MRALIDFRAALRQRTGVGEYTHQTAAAILKRRAGERSPIALTLFSSSWKDRIVPDPSLQGAAIVDRRIPVKMLNLAWHRLQWPTVERLTGRTYDVVHSMHPLLTPSRQAAQVVTIHDLNFLHHPERTRAEIRRDYPALARQHAHLASRVIVVSEFTSREVQTAFELSPDRIAICSPGAPPGWTARASAPPDGYVLFFGTLEPRKNVGALLDAYAHLAERRRDLPQLLLAGQATEQSGPWLARLNAPPLKGLVRHIGYVDPDKRYELYAGARLLVQPSFEEGFGLPVLEAMTVGVPVVAANRGALPEVLGGAGQLVNPDEREDMAAAIARVIDDATLARQMTAAGTLRARVYTWDETARCTMAAYEAAMAAHAGHQGVVGGSGFSRSGAA